MINECKIIEKLQTILDQAEYGTLVIVKLLNRHELNILADDISYAAQNFAELVEDICKNVKNISIFRTEEATKLYLIIPHSYLDRRIIYSIYSQIQHYIDQDFPERYLQCRMASISFPQREFSKIGNLLSALAYGMLQAGSDIYYYNYDHQPIDIEKLRENNCKLTILRQALQDQQAYFAYQPVVNGRTGSVAYHECLLRVPNAHDPYIPIGAIIEQAENKGFASSIDFAVMQMVAAELKKDQGAILSVNISNIGVSDPYLLKRIENLLQKEQIANRLIIEITETSLNRDIVNTRKFVNSLHQYGCKFALDDFGSGFTSFKQLADLPIDVVKIDGSYIRGLSNDVESKYFVEAMIKLARSLGRETVAEFVENSKIAEILIELEIDFMQGNFFLPASNRRL